MYFSVQPSSQKNTGLPTEKFLKRTQIQKNKLKFPLPQRNPLIHLLISLLCKNLHFKKEEKEQSPQQHQLN